MRCKKCNARLAAHDIWCMSCGSQSPIVKTELSAMASLRASYEKLQGKWSEYVPVSSIAIILGLIPIMVLLYILNFVISLDNRSDIQYLLNLIVKSILFGIFVPMVLLPFSKIGTNRDYSLKLGSVADFIKPYGRYLIFSLINTLYFVLIHIICFGLPGFASDPILRLVWIVLLNYWVAIVLPVPILMEHKQINPLRAILLSYLHFHDLRWNIYLLALVLIGINALAFILAVFPLLFTLPLSYFAIRDYTLKLIDYQLLEHRIV